MLRPETQIWLDTQKAKNSIFCGCGCGGEIEVKPYHKWAGIPKYLHGHNSKGTHRNWSHPHKEDCQCCSCRSKRGECSSSPEVENLRRQKISRTNTGRVSPLLGKEQPKLQGNNNPNKRPEIREKHKKTQTKLWKDPGYRIALVASHQEYSNRPEVKKKQKRLMDQLWQDPDYIQKQMNARGCRPNRPELQLQRVLDELFPDEWLYVGDGRNKQYILGGRVPDFVHRTRRLIIELFGDYWHSREFRGIPVKEHVRERTEHFAQHKYQTLIIWEHELKNRQSLSEKLLCVTNGWN